MDIKELFKKIASNVLVLNILGMIGIVIILIIGVKIGLSSYTRHGESTPVPDLNAMTFSEAKMLLEQNGMFIMVGDSGHNKRLPADCILAQNPKAGSEVKQGRVIYVTVNSPSSPSFVIPDIIDNSSVREATAKLTAIGFKLLDHQYVSGEKDWVYGIICKGRNLINGERVSIDTPLKLQVGGGYDGGAQDIDYSDADFATPGISDDFMEVSEPPTEGLIE